MLGKGSREKGRHTGILSKVILPVDRLGVASVADRVTLCVLDAHIAGAFIVAVGVIVELEASDLVTALGSALVNVHVGVVVFVLVLIAVRALFLFLRAGVTCDEVEGKGQKKDHQKWGTHLGSMVKLCLGCLLIGAKGGIRELSIADRGTYALLMPAWVKSSLMCRHGSDREYLFKDQLM
jgi:hypothetical protein